MNQYGQRALDHSRQHRPVAYSQIPDPETFFDAIGEEVAAEVTHLRDEMLGPIGTDETPEAYRLRSYQALAIAEELILADHHLFRPIQGWRRTRTGATIRTWTAATGRSPRSIRRSTPRCRRTGPAGATRALSTVDSRRPRASGCRHQAASQPRRSRRPEHLP